MRLWKVFRLNGKELFAYTLPEESLDEETTTLHVLAAENHCRVQSIKVTTELR